ncbi:AraC family transcriptional regulator [Paenibacillus koleovorans]|uniref:AraC family transcriptional regulator n=1 Tax=Paenibacillus koleovorans TaxID=121608 RepID=UPI000FDC79D9|nr:AraC family transcriptional regulator [Paenibacillus koleovorans]
MYEQARELFAKAELKLYIFDIHRLTAINIRNRTLTGFYMMTYVKSGTAKLRVGDEVRVIPPGSVILIPPGVEHDQYKDSPEETEFLWWHFTYKLENVVDVMKFLQLPYLYPLEDTTKFETVFAELMAGTEEAGGLLGPILQKAKALELLYLLLDGGLRQHGRMEPRTGSSGLLGLLLELVQQPGKPVPLRQLASRLHLNATYLSNRFKELFGESPVVLQRKIVVERAKSLLRQTDMSIGEIALAMGYPELTNFTRLFKGYAGVSPQQYRQLEVEPL